MMLEASETAMSAREDSSPSVEGEQQQQVDAVGRGKRIIVHRMFRMNDRDCRGDHIRWSPITAPGQYSTMRADTPRARKRWTPKPCA
jgi:hypothetical protein